MSRKRKVIENNLKDMLVDTIETDTYPFMLPFKNGVLDICSGKFYKGQNQKIYLYCINWI